MSEFNRSARKMSALKILIVIYLVIGLIVLTVAVASRGKEKRIKGFEVFAYAPGDGFDVIVLFFMALFWPAWLILSYLNRDPRE